MWCVVCGVWCGVWCVAWCVVCGVVRGVWCSVVWCGVVWYDVVWCCVVVWCVCDLIILFRQLELTANPCLSWGSSRFRNLLAMNCVAQQVREPRSSGHSYCCCLVAFVVEKKVVEKRDNYPASQIFNFFIVFIFYL
jgi:hypothetical protein